jgi:hypothetical protein
VTPTIVPSPLSGLVATTPGATTADDHAAARIALCLLVIVVAGMATAQLPASRRSPHQDEAAF